MTLSFPPFTRWVKRLIIMLIVTSGIVALANRLRLGGGSVRLRDN